MKLFDLEKPVIGMIHLDALPGTPKFKGSVNEIIVKALREASDYKKLGIPVLMIENMHDVPYVNRVSGPEITAVMSIILYEIKKQSGLPTGIQILAGANIQALGAAKAAGADFIRAEGFVFAHVADEGIFSSDAGEILRYRKSIEADKVLVFTDIKKKHSSHAITADTDIAETAKAAEFFLSDGVIVTGSSTGSQPSVEEMRNVKSAVNIPVLAGSGITPINLHEFYPYCDAFIVGSYFKIDGKWVNALDPARIKHFLEVKAGLS
ncbi:MAG: BtpA/SgcQ family protein [Ignavibacteriales bacterium]|nr:BtpA/SgcQ family protein [Ignavibacteriales bacterium]